ncbi:MAG: hypothetical protein E7K64_00745 [Clostridia bacterium]|nr:hypothetical protein [Clostridiales bacterium]MDU7504559.1 hypothetical protein [Clostridia bacterium]
MPALEKTPFLGLNRWKGNEYVKREDFINDNDSVDECVMFLSFCDMTIVSGLKNMSYFYDKAGDTHTEIVGKSKETPFMKRTSTKTETGWTIKLVANGMNAQLEYQKTSTGWEVIF